MEEISTNNKLLLLAYNELTEAEAAALHTEIIASPALSEEWEKLQMALQNLDDLQLAPRETSIRIVEEESKDVEHA